MFFAFEQTESVNAGAHRIMREQLYRARERLADTDSPVDGRIHDARKRFKEIRALLRMLRGPLGETAATEGRQMRDAARELASARDAAAVIESLQKLAALRRLPRGTPARALRMLKRRQEAPGIDLEQLALRTIEAVDAIESRLATWPSLPDSFDALETGLERTYRSGRRGMHAAVLSGMPEHFHEWRKRVKDQWYQAQLLRNVWPEMTKAWTSSLDDLAKALGDHHDLFVLRGLVAASPEGLGSRRNVVALLDAIAERQCELESEAARLGSRIYAEKPRAWLARIRKLWSAWRTEGARGQH